MIYQKVIYMNENAEMKMSEVKKTTVLGVEENIEGALCYVLGFVTGIIFLILEKDNKFVKFHAMQSTVVFLLLFVAIAILGTIPLFWLIIPLIWIAELILWLLLMYKAYQKEMFKLPIVGDIAAKQAEL